MKIRVLFFATLLVANQLYAATPYNQYKQFGSIAALSESCLQSVEIKDALQEALTRINLSDQILRSLIGAYNEGYNGAILEMKIWNASQASWNKTSFSCDQQKDVELIRDFQEKVVASLR